MAHHCCAAWSEGVIQTEEYQLLYVDKAVFTGLSQVNVWFLYQFICLIQLFSQAFLGLY